MITGKLFDGDDPHLLDGSGALDLLSLAHAHSEVSEATKQQLDQIANR